MDDLHIVSNNDNDKPKKNSSVNAILMFGSVLVLFVFSVGGGAYYFGRQSVKGVQTSIIPSPFVQNTVPSGESPSPVAADSSLSSVSATPNVIVTGVPSPISKSVLVRTKSSLDGYIYTNGKIDIASDIRIGRSTDGIVRGFVAFDLNDLPRGVQIQKAVLRLYQAKIEGDPFLQLGALKIDHLTYGDSVDASDYAAPALSSGFATIPQSTGNSWKEVDVTPRVKDDIANARSFSQFRIHFTTEKIGPTTDFISFESTENTNRSGNIPQLLVSY